MLKAGWPAEIPALQISRMCASSLQAAHFASQAIASGDAEIVVACGVEMMGHEAIGSDALKPIDTIQCAQLIADHWNLTREEQDAFAAQSHLRMSKAQNSGAFNGELLPIAGVTRDMGVRPKTTAASLARLRSLKPGGTVTAATASQLSDGASALLMASDAACDKYGLTRRARVVSRAVVGSDPVMQLTGPIPATRKALALAGLTMDYMDAIEINEAFASVVLAWCKEMDVDPASPKLNPLGGAIAHGHPLGATGAILVTKMVHHLERTGGRYGLIVLCIGGGMSNAMIIERCQSYMNAPGASRL